MQDEDELPHRQRRMARGQALGPSKVPARMGVPTQARAAIGRAAAAQVPRVRRCEYCGRDEGSVSRDVGDAMPASFTGTSQE